MNNKIRKRLIAALLFITVLGIGVVVWATTGSNNVERLRIENKTRSLIVQSVLDKGDFDGETRFEITVKNGYSSPIAIYRLRISDEQTGKNTIRSVERGGLTDGWTIKPSEISTIDFVAAPKRNVMLTIAAVLFDDGNGDGEINDLNRLRELREGVRIGYEKILPILRQGAKTDESSMSDTTLQNLEKEIEEISDKNTPINLRHGFTQAKSFVGFEIKDIREKLRTTPNLSIKAEINKRLAKLEETTEKLLQNAKIEFETDRKQK